MPNEYSMVAEPSTSPAVQAVIIQRRLQDLDVALSYLCPDKDEYMNLSATANILLVIHDFMDDR
jgi:hypothetical protein